MSALQAQAALPSGLGALEAAAAAATADAAAGAAPPVEPGSLDEARAQLVSERARRQLCESELLTLKRQTDDALDRQLADPNPNPNPNPNSAGSARARVS